MSIKNENKNRVSQTSKRRSNRNKRCKYPSKVYGARLKSDDAKILDDYGIKHNLGRSDVVRYALHQFAIKQQMNFNPNDHLSKLQEQVISEKIEPVNSQLNEIATTLNILKKEIVDNQHQGLFSNTGNDFKESKSPAINAESIIRIEQLFAEQQKTLEQTLVAATLALRLIVNYSVEPALHKITTGTTGEKDRELITHLQAAEKGRTYWSEPTRQVVRRTGKRILFELNFITKEEFEESLLEE